MKIPSIFKKSGARQEALVGAPDVVARQIALADRDFDPGVAGEVNRLWCAGGFAAGHQDVIGPEAEIAVDSLRPGRQQHQAAAS